MSTSTSVCVCMDKCVCAHQLTGQLTAVIEVKIREVDEVRQHTHITYAIPTHITQNTHSLIHMNHTPVAAQALLPPLPPAKNLASLLRVRMSAFA